MKNYINWINESIISEKILDLMIEQGEELIAIGEDSLSFTAGSSSEDAYKTKIKGIYSMISKSLNINDLNDIYEFSANDYDDVIEYLKDKNTLFKYIFSEIINGFNRKKEIYSSCDETNYCTIIHLGELIFENKKIDICEWSSNRHEQEFYYFISADSLIDLVMSLDSADKILSVPISVIKELNNLHVLSPNIYKIVKSKIHSSDFNI